MPREYPTLIDLVGNTPIVRLERFGRGQLAVLEDRVAARRAVFARYAEAFADLPLEGMPELPRTRHTRWLGVFLAETSAQRDAVIEALAKDDIEARPVWKPMHLQPVFAGCEVYGGAVSQRLFEHGLCIPSGSSLTAEQRDMVVTEIRWVFARG